jgi:competence protein ComEA
VGVKQNAGDRLAAVVDARAESLVRRAQAQATAVSDDDVEGASALLGTGEEVSSWPLRAVLDPAPAGAEPPGLDDATVPGATGVAREPALRAAAEGYRVRHGMPHLVGSAQRGRRDEAGRRPRVRWGVSRRLAGGAVVTVLLLAGAVVLRTEGLRAGEPVALGTPAPDGSVGTASAAGLVVVDVTGQVRSPGVVRLAAGSRVLDALAAAGGSTPAADLAAINLARPLVDGEQVVVPTSGQSAGGPSAATDGLLDLNAASVAELDQLPGVGPVLAGRIVEHRPFRSVDELDEVPGVGPALLDRLRPKVRV